MSILLVILGIVLFIGLVIVHEFGHFVAARKSGVDVEEFGIGFPPKAKTIAHKNGTEYTLNWLPLGGFVRLKGEHDSADEAGTFGAARLRDKVKIMLAGVFMNLVTAFLLLTLLALIGIPVLLSDPNTGENIQYTVASDTKIVSHDIFIGAVGEDSPAESSGLRRGDVVVGYANELCRDIGTCEYERFDTSAEFGEYTQSNAGERIHIIAESDNGLVIREMELRNTEEVEESIRIAKEQNNPKLIKGYSGATPVDYTIQRNTWSAPIVAAGLIKQMTQLTLSALGDLVVNLVKGDTKQATASVSGPVGIFVLIKDGSLLGFQFILMIIAVISLTLAIMNALPIPALDGGRLFVTLLFKALNKPLTKETEERIHGTGFMLLMALFILITIVDIRRFF